MSTKTVVLEVRNYKWCKTAFEVSTDTELEGVHARLTVKTGACHVQTYATREELRALAAALLAAAEHAELEAA